MKPNVRFTIPRARTANKKEPKISIKNKPTSATGISANVIISILYHDYKLIQVDNNLIY